MLSPTAPPRAPLLLSQTFAYIGPNPDSASDTGFSGVRLRVDVHASASG